MFAHKTVQRTTRLSFRALLIVAITTLIGTFAVAGPAWASKTTCNYDLDGGNITICMAVVGNGLTVVSATATLDVIDFNTADIQVCVHSDDTGAALSCTPFEDSGVHDISTTWAPKATEPPGKYCANGWHPNGVYIGQSCVGVTI